MPNFLWKARLHSPLLLCVMFSVSAYANTSDKFCDIDKSPVIKNTIEQDFLNNLTIGYKQMASELGTAHPKLIEPASVSIRNGAYIIPFTAVGQTKKIKLIGNFDCETGNIEYSVDNTG